jgi:hypothetical protein
LENVNPGINPRFLSQNMAAKEPEKKMPSTQAKATRRVRKGCTMLAMGTALSGVSSVVGGTYQLFGDIL